MKIYRVEDDFGGGPYNGIGAPEPWTRRWRILINGNESRDPIHQPNPVDDLKITFIDRHYRFAFKDIDQLIFWFGDDARKSLSEGGYLVSQYDVPDEHVIVGGHQVAYDRRKAKLIKREPIPITKTSEPVNHR